MLDLSALMTSRDEAPPSGENLEYDMDFINLSLAAAPGEERQEGSTIHAAEDPDWPEVKAKALVVLERAHDLRAAGFLAQAAIGTDGLQGFAEVARYFRGCLEDFWDSVHPQLDPDDDNDPTARVNAVRVLADNEGVLRLLRALPLTESRGFGYFGLREMQYASGEAPTPSGVEAPDAAAIAAAFQDSDREVLNAKSQSIGQALEHVRAIDRVFGERVPGQGPDLDPLIRLLAQMQKSLAPHVDTVAEPVEEAADTGAGETAAAPAVAVARPVSGEITSSRDVTQMLDRILAYYERYEPSSPVPLILHRARRLVGADFMTIMRDLAPQGVSEVAAVSGEQG